MVTGRSEQRDSHPFLVLSENRLAVFALQHTLSGNASASQRLVTLVGPAGCGKSHLIRQAVREHTPTSSKAKLLLVTASEFSAQFAEAAASGSESQFQTQYRRDVDLLVVEDIQVLGPRTETQQQLLAALDDVVAQGGACVLSSSLPPGEISTLNPRLLNRIHGGVCAYLDLPTVSSRVKLTEHLASARQFTLDARTVQLVAERLTSPREILGLINRLCQMRQRARRGMIAEVEIERILNEQPVWQGVSIAQVAQRVAREFRLPLAEIRGPRRSHSVLIPRQAAMYLSRELGGCSYTEIGEYFGGRNHNTVLYACRRIESLMADDARIAQQIQTLRASLETAGAVLSKTC